MAKIKFTKFGATWCHPCKMFKPIIDEVAKDFPDVEFVDVDVDDKPDLATKNNIRSIPTYIISDEQDNILFRGQGLASKVSISNQLKQFVE